MPSPKSLLDEFDREVLLARGISEAAARRNHLRTGNGELLIPFADLGGTYNCYFIRRPHDPPIRDGKPIKYIAPFGVPTPPYFPAEAREAIADPTADVFVTEGMLKAIALSEAGFPTVGLVGVWNWKLPGVDSLSPGLAAVPWTDRRVYVVFDYDPKPETRAEVKRARDRLAGALYAAGAREVLTVELPPGPGGAKQGVDDYLKAQGADAFRSLVAKARALNTQRTQKRGSEPNPSEVLLKLAEVGEYWHTPDDVPCVTVRRDGHREHWSVRSRAFRAWLGREYYRETKKAAGTQTVADVVNTLEGKARFDGETHPFPVRVAELGGKIYLDLTDDEWRAVEIDADGWRVVDDPPVRFRRSKAMAALPVPEPGGTVADLRGFANVDEGDWVLVLGWLVAAVRPAGPYPLLRLKAEQGSGKSTLARLLRDLIDPNTAPLRSAPKGERDLMIAATNGWLVCLDNLSYVDPELSDSMSRLATGGGFSTRTLYADDEETIFSAQRPVILNGIEDVGFREDLLDRTVVVELLRIEPTKRKTEEEFDAAFDAARPKLLGVILTAVSAALKNLPTVTAPEEGWPRMADFAKWVVAAEPALGLEPGTFLKAYAANRATAGRVVLESSPVVAALLAYLGKYQQFDGTATKLLGALNIGQDTRVKGWPGNARALSGQLSRVAPNLRAAGYVVEPRKDKNERLWRIEAPPAPTAADPSAGEANTQSTQSTQKTGPRPTGAKAPTGAVPPGTVAEKLRRRRAARGT